MLNVTKLDQIGILSKLIPVAQLALNSFFIAPSTCSTYFLSFIYHIRLTRSLLILKLSTLIPYLDLQQ